MAVVTTEANALVEPIHYRVPVILYRENESTWLDADESTAEELLDPYRGDDRGCYPISTVVDDQSNDSIAVIERI